MFITSSIICALIPELKENYLFSQIQGFKLSPDQKELLILIRKERESKTLLFSADPSHCRIVSLTEDESRLFRGWATTSLFSRVLDNTILNIEQVDFDRVIKFSCQKETESEKVEYEIFFELTGRNANAILVQSCDSKFGIKSGMILDSLKKVRPAQSRVRQILPGIKYLLPPAPKKHNPFSTTEEQFRKIIQTHPEENLIQILISHFMGMDELTARKIEEESLNSSPLKPLPVDIIWKSFQSIFNQISTHKISPHLILDTAEKPVGISLFDLNSIPESQKTPFSSLNQALKNFFFLEIEKSEEVTKLQNLSGLIQKAIEKWEKRGKKLKDELSSLQEAQAYKKFGDLILNHLTEIKRGVESIELSDFSTPEHQKVKVALDPSLSPKENALAYYKKYRKAQTGLEKLKEIIIQTENEIKELSRVAIDLQKKERLDYKKIEAKLSSFGLLKTFKPKRKEKKKGRYALREFVSADGWKILVGRNNRENDFLTFKIARPEDLWFHAQNTPGSHVVLKKGERKKHPTPKSIQQAASLAAYYSKAKTSKKVSVIYTLAKYVKKPKNAPPGLVKVEKMKSILIEPKLIKG
ncbi:MAG: NFACT family protein [candidate division Zixibacteria bacterium]|nr:NFACT family protein [candidate division Zixibacteria bacterium]